MKNYLAPYDLIQRLAVAPTVEVEFHSERALGNYRQALYKVNGSGRAQFSTRRRGLTLVVVRFG